jgi:predicted DNA-binding transcriptional regulator YafY
MHRPATLRYLGGKTTPSTTLSADEIHAIADTWRLSQAVSSMAPMASRLEQLKAKLQLARDQQARRSTDDDDASAEQ